MLHILKYVNYAEVNVHKTMFLQTLAVTDMIVRTPVRKLQGGNYVSPEKRGCYKHVPQVLNIMYLITILHLQHIGTIRQLQNLKIRTCISRSGGVT
jgi:hypothetical protein